MKRVLIGLMFLALGCAYQPSYLDSPESQAGRARARAAGRALAELHYRCVQQQGFDAGYLGYVPACEHLTPARAFSRPAPAPMPFYSPYDYANAFGSYYPPEKVFRDR